MKYSIFFALILTIGLAAGPALAQERYAERRDLRQDYATADRLRADIARDQYRLNENLRYRRRREARDIKRDIDRDKRQLRALDRDIRSDQRHDQRRY